jgi:hypothetical protein
MIFSLEIGQFSRTRKFGRLTVTLSRWQVPLFLHYLGVHHSIQLNRSILGIKPGNFSCISTDLDLYYCNTSFCNCTKKITANWLLGFKCSSVPLLLLRTFELATQPSRISLEILRHFTTNAKLFGFILFIIISISLLIIAPETICAGSLACYAEWTMETTIGNLGKEICQDKDPYHNLKECGVIYAQINFILALYLKLDITYGACGPSIQTYSFSDKYAFLP